MSFDFSEKKKYVAIYGEIRNLGKIQRRQGIQSVLNRINEEYNASFTLNEGYYIEGILTSIDHLPKILLLITNEFLPLQVVYGVAIGEGSEVDCSDVFNLAKEALYNVINLKHKKEKALSNIMLLVQNDKGIKNIALNSIFKLLYIIESHWTNKQRAIIHTMLENVTQAQVASMYEVSASNVTQMLTNGHYFTYKEAIDNLEILLKDAFEGISE